MHINFLEHKFKWQVLHQGLLVISAFNEVYRLDQIMFDPVYVERLAEGMDASV